MNPEQPPITPPSIPTPPLTPTSGAPIDYLNQISTKPAKKTLNMKQQIMLAGLGLVVALILIAVIGALLRPNLTPEEDLAAKMQTTEAIANNAQNTIQSSQLSAFNSNLTINLTNAVRDIHQPLLASGVNTNSLDPNIVASESGDAITARLRDAQLNGVYDATYAREIAYQLELMTASMQQIYKTTGNQSLKSFLSTTYTNLLPIQTEFENFNDANS